MRKTFFTRAMICLVASAGLMHMSSCVNEQYEISKDKLDLTVKGFQEGVSLPLGSSERLRLDSLIKKLGLEEDFKKYLMAGADSAYSIYYKAEEPYDLSENLKSLSGLIDIDKVDFGQNVDFDLAGVDISGISFKGKKYEVKQDLSEMFSDFKVNIPPITENFEIDANLRKYSESISAVDIAVDLGEHGGLIDLVEVPGDLAVPAGLQSDNTNYSISEISGLLGKTLKFKSDIENASVQTHLSYKFPKEIKSVSDLHLADGAKLTVSVSIVNSCFTAGKVVPHVDLDLGKLFHLSNEGGHVSDDHIISDFTLEGNEWHAEESYSISSLIIGEDDWTYETDAQGNQILCLDKLVDVAVSGNFNDDGLKISPASLHQWLLDHPEAEDRMVQINVKLGFENFLIDDATVVLNPIPVETTETFDVSIPEMKFPNEVKSVDEVKFTDESVIDVNLAVAGLSAISDDLDFELDHLEVTFPDRLIIGGADATNTVIVSGADLAAGPLDRQIKITGIKVGALDENGYAPAYEGEVKVLAVGKVGGSLHTGKLPYEKDDDIKIVGAIDAQIALADYTLTIRGYEVNSETDPDVFKTETFGIEIPKELVDIKGLVVYLENDPKITVETTIPEVSVDVRPIGEKGLTIYLPSMLKLKKGGYPYEAWYDEQKHVLKFPSDKDFPENLDLPIDHIVIDPVLDETDGKYYSKGEIRVEGAVGILENSTMNMKDVETLAEPGCKVSFVATIPALKPDAASMESYTASLEESIDFEPLKDVELPDMLKEVGQIVLDDVYLSLAVKTGAGFPSLGDDAVLSVGADVTLPEFIKVDPSRMTDGKLKVEGTLKKNAAGNMEVVIDPVKVESLDLNLDFDGLKTLKDSISVAGAISLTGADIVLDEWLDKKHQVEIVANLCTIRNGAPTDKVGIRKVTGKVDYQLDPVKMTVDLSSVSEYLDGDNLSATVDLSSFYLALDMKTNLGVPVMADLDLIPYYGAEAGTVVTRNITLSPAESADKQESTRIWISNLAPDQTQEYDHYLDVDILSMLYKDAQKSELIDSLCVNLNAGTDPQQECIYEPSAEYSLTVDYAAGIPLEFGEDFELVYRDTIADLPDVVGMLMGYAGKLGLGGEIESSLPFNVHLLVRLLDSEGNMVAQSAVGEGPFIKSADAMGNAVKTDIDIIIAAGEGVDVSDIAAVEFEFRADTKSAPGVPLKENSYIKVNRLFARVPEGISLDIADFVFDDEENESEGDNE